MLNCYQSNQTAALKEIFIELYKQQPKSVFNPQWIMVPSKGFGTWLKQQMTQNLGIFSNVKLMQHQLSTDSYYRLEAKPRKKISQSGNNNHIYAGSFTSSCIRYQLSHHLCPEPLSITTSR